MCVFAREISGDPWFFLLLLTFTNNSCHLLRYFFLYKEREKARERVSEREGRDRDR